jgi:hypothetical protein
MFVDEMDRIRGWGVGVLELCRRRGLASKKKRWERVERKGGRAKTGR